VRKPTAYGWVKTGPEGWITEVSVKVPISAQPALDPGIIGSFWFRKARYFVEAAEELIRQNRRVNNEFYADACVTVLVEQGRRARLFDVQRYLCWGTPDDLRTWDYWEGHFRRTGQL
jgi:hypothetical protein